MVKGFTKSDRGQLIMACGTGKTLTSLFIKEKLDAERDPGPGAVAVPAEADDAGLDGQHDEFRSSYCPSAATRRWAGQTKTRRLRTPAS